MSKAARCGSPGCRAGSPAHNKPGAIRQPVATPESRDEATTAFRCMSDHEKSMRLAAACRRMIDAKRELKLAEAELKAATELACEPEPETVKR